MKEYHLSISDLKNMVVYDPVSGKLYWKQRDLSSFKNEKAGKIWNIRFAGKEAFKSDVSGYFVGLIKNRRYYAHVVAWSVFNDR